MKMTIVRGLALALFVIGASATPVVEGEDVLCLKDGRILDQLTMKRSEGGVTITFENGDVFVPGSLIVDALIQGDSGYTDPAEDDPEKRAKGLVPFDGDWISPARRDALIKRRLAERRAAVEEMLEHQNWANRYQEETKHFAFEYTVPKHIFEGYRDRMEAYFTIFAKDWRVKQPRKQGKLSVCFYGNKKEFHRTSGAGSYVLGYFRFVEPYDLNIYYDRLDPKETEDVMFHEANHYLQKLVDIDFSYPHWPGEALAEYYGASEWDEKKKKLTTGLIQEGRLIEIKNDIASGEWMSMEKLITEEMYEDYNWGWSLVHFLMNHPKHEKSFKKFFVALAKGKDVKREEASFGLRTVSSEEMLAAFRRYHGLKTDEDFEELEKHWHAYVEEQLQLVTPSGLEKAAAQAMYTGRPIRAKRLFQEAIDAGTTNPMTFHKYAELLVREGEPRTAESHWKRAIELDPLTGEFYYGLASALGRRDKEEAKRLQALAIELNPDLDREFLWIQ